MRNTSSSDKKEMTPKGKLDQLDGMKRMGNSKNEIFLIVKNNWWCKKGIMYRGIYNKVKSNYM